MAKTKGVGDGGKEVKTTENASLFQSAELFFLSAGLVFLSAGLVFLSAELFFLWAELVFLSAGLENQLAELMEGTGDVQTAALRRPREGNSAI